MPGIFDNIFSQTGFNDLTCVHDRNFFSNLRNNCQVVGNENKPHILFFT